MKQRRYLNYALMILLFAAAMWFYLDLARKVISAVYCESANCFVPYYFAEHENLVLIVVNSILLSAAIIFLRNHSAWMKVLAAGGICMVDLLVIDVLYSGQTISNCALFVPLSLIPLNLLVLYFLSVQWNKLDSAE